MLPSLQPEHAYSPGDNEYNGQKLVGDSFDIDSASNTSSHGFPRSALYCRRGTLRRPSTDLFGAYIDRTRLHNGRRPRSVGNSFVRNGTIDSGGECCSRLEACERCDLRSLA
jgi:hypothetical protein